MKTLDREVVMDREYKTLEAKFQKAIYKAEQVITKAKKRLEETDGQAQGI